MTLLRAYWHAKVAEVAEGFAKLACEKPGTCIYFKWFGWPCSSVRWSTSSSRRLYSLNYSRLWRPGRGSFNNAPPEFPKRQLWRICRMRSFWRLMHDRNRAFPGEATPKRCKTARLCRVREGERERERKKKRRDVQLPHWSRWIYDYSRKGFYGEAEVVTVVDA